MNKEMPIIEHDFRMKVYDMTDKELHQEIVGQWFATKDFDEDQMNILIEELSRRNKAHEALDRMVAENQRLGLYDDAAPYTKLDTKSGVLHKEWVGLTDEDREVLLDNLYESVEDLITAIEAKLKEQNT